MHVLNLNNTPTMNWIPTLILVLRNHCNWTWYDFEALDTNLQQG